MIGRPFPFPAAFLGGARERVHPRSTSGVVRDLHGLRYIPAAKMASSGDQRQRCFRASGTHRHGLGDSRSIGDAGLFLRHLVGLAVEVLCSSVSAASHAASCCESTANAASFLHGPRCVWAPRCLVTFEADCVMHAPSSLRVL